MFKNYIKIAWRNLINQKMYSFLNISGLSVGLAVCMIIMLYIAHEKTYDRFHKNAGRIFIPAAAFKMGGTNISMATMSYASAPLIKQEQPAVESYERILSYFTSVPVTRSSDQPHKFLEDKLLFADAGFFNFFSFKLLSGNPTEVLKKPFSVVLSKDMAVKYFGKTDPIGQTIKIKTDSVYTYQVTGVAENNPSNSSIQYNFVVPVSSLQVMKEAGRYSQASGLGFGSYTTYLLLKNAADTALLKKTLALQIRKTKGFENAKFTLSPLAGTHLDSGNGDQSNIKYLKIFPLIGFLILLLALVNYMSLSTAKATLRAKEVGVRKVSGASRESIAAQFFTESALFTCVSFICGYILCYVFKPWFLSVLQLKIDNSFLYSPLVLFSFSALLIITILAAGIYPSLVLSAFKPVLTLKGKSGKQAGGVTVRKVFTTLQFSIAICLIICGIVIDRQLYFFRHADTGINRDNVVMIPLSNTFMKNYVAYKSEVTAIAGVSNVAASRYAMFKGYDGFDISGATKNEHFLLPSLVVDNNFEQTLGLKWKYRPPYTTGGLKDKVLINELAIAALHLPANPIGSVITSGTRKTEINGVVRNFNFSSLQFAMQPLGLFIVADTSAYWKMVGGTMFARIKPHTNLPTVLSTLQRLYNKYEKDTPFSYSFIDDAFNQQYKAEDRLASIFSIFTLITILLATLGLFGLAAFTIEQRTKEIGIRKVLGASLASIASLLSTDFLKLVLLAILIASPVAWWCMHNWLQNFAYRITISAWMFLLAGFLAIITAIITVSYHALRSAVANPIKSLRSE